MPTYKFKSRIERLDTGLRMHVIPVPAEIANKFVDTKRIVLKIGPMEMNRAIQGIRSREPLRRHRQAQRHPHPPRP